MVMYILIVAFAAIVLFKDLMRDKGAFIKAKVVHALCMAYLILLYGNSITTVPRMLRGWDRFAVVNRTQFGFIPPDWNLYSVTANFVMGNILLFIAFAMLNSRDKPRRFLLVVLLLNIPLATTAYYRGWLQSGPAGNDALVLCLLFVFACLIHGGLFLIYRSRMMVEFFAVPPVQWPPKKVGETLPG